MTQTIAANANTRTRTLIADITVGHRTILGTRWPVEHVLHREQRSGRVRWIVTRNLCNGVPDGATEHRTLRAARAEYDSLCEAASGTTSLDDLRHGDAWDIYVGSQSTREWSEGDAASYVESAPACEGLTASERAKLAALLEAHRARS